ILTGSEDGTVRLWDATTGEMTGLFLCFLPDGGVAILDAPSLSLRSGPAEVWDYLGRPEILAGQLTRVGVERRQYLNSDPLPTVVSESSPAEATDEDPTTPEPVDEAQVPEATEPSEGREASEADVLGESVDSVDVPSVFAVPAQPAAESAPEAEQPAAPQSPEDAPAQAPEPSAPAGEPLIEEAPAEAQAPQVEEPAPVETESSEIPEPVPAPEVEDPAAAHQARHAAVTAHTPTEAAEAPEGVGQPVTQAQTEPVAAPTGETLLVQPFPVEQGLVDGEVSAPAVTPPTMVEMPPALTAPEGDRQEQSEAQPLLSTPEAAQEADAETGADAFAVPAPEAEATDGSRRARHAAATAHTPADAPEQAAEGGTEAAEAARPTEPELASPTDVAHSSGTAESAYEPVAIPAVEHAGGEPVAAPTGETVAPDQLELPLTPADATAHEGDEVTLDLSEEATEAAAPAGSEDAHDAVDATDAVDAPAPEVPLSSDAEATSAPTASTPAGEPEDRAVPETPTEQAPVEHPQAQDNPERSHEPEEAETLQPTDAEASAEGRPSAEEEAAEPAEPTPAPWGSADLRQRIYTEVQEFVAAIARRDVNELASRYGIAGNDLAGLDEQLAGLSSPASDLTLYPVEQADDYVNGHHRLDLSELEGGGVVISSELWAHDRPCGARLIAHWNPMGIYPFDFRNVSM
ncbi:hypothetical protein, partial [Actinomyces oris]|uniref:hypothetical protein n=1 Tax=Actinomyces oris TaxID=544580 RepID=UPI00288C4471